MCVCVYINISDRFSLYALVGTLLNQKFKLLDVTKKAVDVCDPQKVKPHVSTNT